ncbi:hypothetical protein HYX16_01400 [Candidatus Woesearchaeota archaeon]|nr:hypothetical protein [Candidatus Woesearchaeota archaeon]
MENQEFKEQSLDARLDEVPEERLAVKGYDPADDDNRNELMGIREKVYSLVSGLPFKKGGAVLRLRFGFDGYDEKSLTQIALNLGKTYKYIVKLKEKVFKELKKKKAVRKLKEKLTRTVVF